MKKLILTVAAALGIAFASQAANYTLVDNQMEQKFAQATDVTSTFVTNLDGQVASQSLYNANMKGGDTNLGGYLVRCIFCGYIALHRGYMGGDMKKLWWKYLCIPCANGVAIFTDFWWPIFKSSNLDKYKSNDKFFVQFGK